MSPLRCAFTKNQEIESGIHAVLFSVVGVGEPLAGFDVALVGFPYDEGVVRNGGREGATGGPDDFRSLLPKNWNSGQSRAQRGPLISETYNLTRRWRRFV